MSDPCQVTVTTKVHGSPKGPVVQRLIEANRKTSLDIFIPDLITYIEEVVP